MTKYLLILMLCATSFAGQPKSICGENDDRVLSYDIKIGRLAKGDRHMGCTVTMISDTCGITAGHCAPVLEYAEFDTPMSSRLGIPRASKLSNKYYIDQKTIIKQEGSHKLGNDWAVLNFKKNKRTGMYPGEANGYYKIGLRIPKEGEKLVITGFGVDKVNKEKNCVQQTHYGYVKSINRAKSLFDYDVDTMGGNSGSSILNSKNEIIGIHTNGGCNIYGTNKGVMIRDNRMLRNAITKCLAR